MTLPPNAALPRGGLWLLATLLLIGSVLTLTQLGDIDFVRQSECRTAVAAREMLASGDFLIPRVNDRPRFEKPPLYYWAIAAVAGTPEAVSVSAARLPSVLSALASLILLGGLAARRVQWASNAPPLAAGLSAALVLLSLPGFWQRATLADAESLLALTCLAVATCLYAQLQRPAPQHLIWAYALSAVAFMAKGPVFLLFTWPAYLWLARAELKPAARQHLTGLAVFALLAGAWYAAVLWRDAQAFDVFHREVAMRFDSREATHPQPAWFYLGQLFAASWPLGVLLPLAVYAAWQRRGQRAEAYVLLNVAGALLALSLLKTKQTHYLLPLLPWLALWLADLACWQPLDLRWRWPARGVLIVTALLGVVAVALGWAYGLNWVWCAALSGVPILSVYLWRGSTDAPLRTALLGLLLLTSGAYIANEAVFKPLRALKFDHSGYFAALHRLTGELAVGFDDACFYYGYGPVRRASRVEDARSAYWLSDNAPSNGKLRNYHRARLEWLWQTTPSAATPPFELLSQGQVGTTLRAVAAPSLACLNASAWEANDVALLQLSIQPQCSARQLVDDLKQTNAWLQSELKPWKALWLAGEFRSDGHGRLAQRVLARGLLSSDATLVLDPHALAPTLESGGALLKLNPPLAADIQIDGANLTLNSATGGAQRWQRQTAGARLSWQRLP